MGQDGIDYAEAIRMDKGKTIPEHLMMLKKQAILLRYKNAPINALYLMMNFFIMLQVFALSRESPSNIWLDIMFIIILIVHTYLMINITRRYLLLEMKNFYIEAKTLEEEKK